MARNDDNCVTIRVQFAATFTAQDSSPEPPDLEVENRCTGTETPAVVNDFR
jgi:hypothetical protein